MQVDKEPPFRILKTYWLIEGDGFSDRVSDSYQFDRCYWQSPRNPI